MTDTHFHRRSVLGGMAGLAAGAFVPPALAQVMAGTSRPNLILYFPDEMRADALGCYGNPVCRTPNFDLLARSGTRFADCHVQYPVCGASRCSLLTGWPTSAHGHRSLYYLLRPEEPNMFRYLRQAGYDVYWFGKNDALAQQSFDDSVTHWYDNPAGGGEGGGAVRRPVAGQPTTMLAPAGGDRRATNDYRLLQHAFEVINQKERDRPFCIFLPLFQPHPPYTSPADFNTMYKPADLPPLAPPNLPNKPDFHAGIRDYYHLGGLTDADFRQVRATYYGQISYADWLLGELLETLDKSGRSADTAIFMSSDHGDYAGDYGLIEKWPSGLESCLTHVPMIARIPGGKAGHVVNEMTELYDIMPSMLALAGTRARHTHFAHSLIPQLHGAAGEPDRASFSEGGYNLSEPQAFEPVLPGPYEPKTRLQNEKPEMIRRSASVKTHRYNFVARPGGQSELYDRVADPKETRNLYGQAAYRKVQDEMEQRLLDWYVTTTGIPGMDRDRRDTPPSYLSPDAARQPVGA